MKPIDYGGQRSSVNVTIDIYRNKLVNTIKTKPFCASSSNFADMLTMVRGWTLLILEVTGQRWRSWRASSTNVGCTGMLGFALLYLITNSLLISSTWYQCIKKTSIYRIISNISPNSCRNTWKMVKVYDFPQCANFTCVDDLSTQKRQSISQSPRACSQVLCHSLTSFLFITEQEGFSDGLLG